MTCVAGVTMPGGRVVLGADSASASGGTVMRSLTPKVFTAHGIGYAAAGSWRMINVLRHDFTPPPHPDECEDEAYLVIHWLAAFRARLGELGALRKKEEIEGTDDGIALISYRGGLYQMSQDFQVTRDLHDYSAAGSGRDYALGSLVTTAGLGLSAERRVRLALAAAAEHNWAVREPFEIIITGGAA